MKKQRTTAIIGLCLLLALPVFAQKKAKKNKQTAQVTTSFDARLYEGLAWRNIGPFRGGRSNTVSGVIGQPMTYYVGYTGGGIWKTEDAGNNWKNISDGFLKSGSVGDLAVSEADPNVIYAGMGEHAVRGVMTTFGDGVYKSLDAGDTWTHVGLDQTRHISDVVIHPDNPDLVYVAAQGALHGPSEERGIFRSADGGDTWEKVLYLDENTGASSLSMDMNNPRILYAATWEHRRKPWTVESGGPGSNLWKSVDGGETWKKINAGLPDFKGKMGISVSRANSNRVYAIVEAEKSKAGLYRSDDAGKSWKHLSSDQAITSRSWYYMEVFADPVNADVVYVLNAPMMRSMDGGKNFSRVSVGHGDTHDLWINPDNNANMILGDDGGAEVTFNTGGSWSTLNNQPTAQFYRVNADKQFPYKVYGGQQDNSSVVIASRTNGRGITDKDWHSGPGCESAFVAFDNPENPTVLYGGCYQGLIEALNLNTMEGKDIMEYPSLNLAIEPKDMKYRFNWNAPIVGSSHEPGTIYHAGNVVFKTTDGGLSWEQISNDLTRNEAEKQGPGGGPLTNEGAGGENYNTIAYLAESPIEKGMLVTGSDCGLVHLTRDGGKTWTNITPAGMPESYVYSLELSPHNAGTIYLAVNRYKFNDMSAMAYKSTDYGKSWTAINKGIQNEDFLRVIREDTQTPGLLYGGAERGFYISFNGGQKWERFQLNLPVVPVTDLIIRDNDLVASTQGRAFWILDDLGAIQQSAGDFGDKPLILYHPKPTVLFEGGGWGSASNIGTNPTSGVVFQYFLPEKPDSTALILEIMDTDGTVIRTYSSEKDSTFKSFPGGPSKPKQLSTKKGINRFAWDFRREQVQEVEGVFIYGSYRGRRVAPGTYRARLSQGDQLSEVSFRVLPDPRLKAPATAYTEQERIFRKVDNTIEEIHQSVDKLTRIKKQIRGYNELMKNREGKEELYKAGKELLDKINTWEKDIVERRQKNTQDVINWPGKLNAEFFILRSKLDTHDPRVTQGVKDRLEDLSQQWQTAKSAYTQLMDEDISAYNQLFKKQDVPALMK